LADFDRIFDAELSRREVVWNGLTGVAFICSFDKLAKLGTRPSGKTAPARRPKRGSGSPFDPFQVDLPRPPVLQPQAKGGADVYEMEMKPGMASILPGYETPVLGYNGIYPGPTIRAKAGRPVRVVQQNQTDRDLNVHLHGGITEPESDGHPDDFLPPDTARTYRYANDQHAATLFYHDHAHGETAQTLYAGLGGFYLLSDAKERKLGLPRGKYDVPLLIQDRSFKDDGSLHYVPNLDFGFYGDTILVNGAIAPRMAVKRRLYRFRLLNGSNARPYDLRLGNNREMIQIAGDTSLLPRPVKRTAIPLDAAERAEVLIDFSKFRPGTELVLHNAYNPFDQGSVAAVMRFDVEGGGGKEQFQVPKKMLPREKVPEPTMERTFKLDISGYPTPEDAPRWEINDMGFDTNRVDATPTLGTTETWTWVNESARIHPMHMHGFHFHVIEVNGEKPHPADRGWKDIVSVKPFETVKVRPYFRGFPGRYVFHCHAAEHGDHDMFSQMEAMES